MSKGKTWAIIGGGNGGQALAGHLSLMGYTTRLYDIIPATVDAINARKSITLKGAVEGTAPVEFATGDIKKAVTGADYIMITVPAMAHAELAEQLAPHLWDGALVYLHPGATLGALEFYCLIKKHGCTADVTVSEANSLIYACRAEEPGVVAIFGLKSELLIGTIPAARSAEALAPFKACFPQARGAANILESSMAYTNSTLHPGPSLLSVALIESNRDWRYYIDGFTPSVGAYMEKLDRERLQICEALDVPGQFIVDWFRTAYKVDKPTLAEATAANPAYQDVKGQKSLYSRYILEDIPNALVPLTELARLFAIPVPRTEAMVTLAYLLLDEEKFPPKRTLQRMGLDRLSGAELKRFAIEGK